MSGVQDAETKESLVITQAFWTSRDGRIDDNPKACILMGTGKLIGSISSSRFGEDVPKRTNSMVRQFEQHGPSNPALNLKTNPRRTAKSRLSPDSRQLPTLGKAMNVETTMALTSSSSSSIVSHGSQHDAARDEFLLVDGEPGQLRDCDWTALELKYYATLSESASAMAKLSSPVVNADRKCRDIAKSRAAFMRQVHIAVLDERRQDATRLSHLKGCLLPTSAIRMRELHKTERDAARENIRRMQHDHEVMLMRDMMQAGLLW